MITSMIIFAAAQAAVPPSTFSKANKVQCHLEYQVFSRIPNKVCLPRSEWQRIEEQNEKDMTSSRNARSTGRSGTIVDNGEGFVVAPKAPR